MAKEEEVTYTFPKAIGRCADKLYKTRQRRLKMQKEVDVVEAEEKALKAHIIDTLPKSQASGVQGKVARVTVVKKEIPQVIDQDKFRKYINRTKRFDLAQKMKASGPAIVEMWDDGKTIPGVEKFTVVTVSLNKV